MPAFTSATASAAARRSHAPGAARHTANGLKQAIDLRDLAYNAAVSIGRGLSPGQKVSREDAIALQGLVRAWESCEERIRIPRNKPFPGSRRPGPAPLRRGCKLRAARNFPPRTGLPVRVSGMVMGP